MGKHSRRQPPAFTTSERAALFHAHAAQETRAVLLLLAPRSPQARRCADAMERLTNFLWPDSPDRREAEHAEQPEGSSP
jgi:hypothetical protein